MELKDLEALHEGLLSTNKALREVYSREWEGMPYGVLESFGHLVHCLDGAVRALERMDCLWTGGRVT
jgi:hypothetical protein